MFLLTQALPMIAYVIIVADLPIKEDIMHNLLQVCPKYENAPVFHTKSFPYIGNTTFAFFAYMGLLFQHKFLTSNMSNNTEIWKAIIRMIIVYLIIYFFKLEANFSSEDANILIKYFLDVFIPVGIGAFLFTAFIDSIFEFASLLNSTRSLDKKSKYYCVFVHEDDSNEHFVDPKTEALLPPPK